MKIKKILYMIEFPIHADEFIGASLKIAGVIGSIFAGKYIAKKTNLITGIMSGLCIANSSLDLSDKIYEKMEDIIDHADDVGGFLEKDWEEEFNQNPTVQHIHSVIHMAKVSDTTGEPYGSYQKLAEREDKHYGSV